MKPIHIIAGGAAACIGLAFGACTHSGRPVAPNATPRPIAISRGTIEFVGIPAGSASVEGTFDALDSVGTDTPGVRRYLGADTAVVLVRNINISYNVSKQATLVMVADTAGKVFKSLRYIYREELQSGPLTSQATFSYTNTNVDLSNVPYTLEPDGTVLVALHGAELESHLDSLVSLDDGGLPANRERPSHYFYRAIPPYPDGAGVVLRFR
ncbi:MAG: hypothetical protein JST22_15300 [Bacteroidetes bacterium]|nr:hypothetical protein [Bacteroidota bacterium]